MGELIVDVNLLDDGQNYFGVASQQPFMPEQNVIKCSRCAGFSPVFHIVFGEPPDDKRIRKMSWTERDRHKRTTYCQFEQKPRVVGRHCENCGEFLYLIVESCR